MMKQAVGFLASVAGIGVLALFVGVVVRLSWRTKTAYPLPSADRAASSQEGA
jgi:hypothetical protein